MDLGPRFQSALAALILFVLVVAAAPACGGSDTAGGTTGSGSGGTSGSGSGGATGSGGAPATMCAPGALPNDGDSCVGFAVGTKCFMELTGEGAGNQCVCTAAKTWSCESTGAFGSASTTGPGSGGVGGLGGAGGAGGA